MEITSYLLGKKAGGGDTPTGTIEITQNGITNVSSYASADVNVQPNLETKSITITENTTTTLTPTSGKDGMSSVSITTDVSGGGGLDWSAIGYSETPESIIDGYDYAIEIKNNWVPATNLSGKFQNNYNNLKFMPLVDTSIATDMSYMFNNCYGLISIPLLDTSSVKNMESMFGNTSIYTIPLLDTSSVTNMRQMFTGCNVLISIPLLDTSSVTNMMQMFNLCRGLKTIPLLDTSSVTNMKGMFNTCFKLTDASLDNILQMCVNAISYTDTKTLQYLGIFSYNGYPASRIQALPHYQDFINAGWTIGF